MRARRPGNVNGEAPAARGRGGAVGVVRASLCVLLSLSVAFAPVDFGIDTKGFAEIRRSEAQAILPAVPAAGAAVVAAAAEMGITAEALQLAIVAGLAATTGYVVANNMESLDGASWGRLWDGSDVGDMTDDDNYADGYVNGELGVAGSKTWGDLSADEKAKYGTPAAYVQGQWTALDMAYGLIEETGGGFQPTEPPEEDSGKFWTKRNVLALLATGGAVALGEVAGAFGDMAGQKLHEWLFGDGEDALGIDYTRNVYLNGKLIRYGLFYGDGVNTEICPVINHYTSRNKDYAQYILPYGMASLEFTESTDKWILRCFSPGSRYEIDGYGNVKTYETSSVGVLLNYSNLTSIEGFDQSRKECWLNIEYGGTYEIGSARFDNGVLTGFDSNTVNYGQLASTPVEIPETITNPQTWITTINNYQNDTGSQDEKRAVVVPSISPGVGEEYSDFVQTRTETDIETVPDDGPADTDKPVKPDEPEVPDYGAAIVQLFELPMRELFPFCLMTDLKDYIERLQGLTGSRDGLSVQAADDYTRLVVPLGAFGVGGLANLELDLTWLAQVGGMVRPFSRYLIVLGLLYVTINFFLKAGGK